MDRRRWWLVGAASFANGLVWLNVSELTPALPTIQREFNATLAELQWISSLSFTLAVSALLVAGGRLGDIYGHKRVFGFGLLGFSLASILSGLAPDATILIVTRGLQGLAAALLCTTSLALIAAHLPVASRGLGAGVYGAFASGMQGAGPVVGGALTTAGAWRLTFWLVPPVAAAIWFVVSRVASEDRQAVTVRALDMPAIAAIALWTIALTLVLSYGPTWGWGSAGSVACWALTAGGLVMLLGRERRTATPLVDLRLFRSPLFSGALLLLFVGNLALVTLVFFVSLYFTNVLGYSALAAGALFIPMTVVSLVSGPITGRLFDRSGPRSANTSVIALAGVGTIGVALATRSAQGGFEQIGLIVCGVGFTGIAVATAGSVVQAVSPAREGTAAGVLTLAATLASTFGLAVAGPLFASFADHDLHRSTAAHHITITRMESGHAIAVLSGSPTGRFGFRQLSRTQRATVHRLARHAFRRGISSTLLPFGILCLVSVIPSLLTQRRRWFFVPSVAAAEGSDGA